MRNFLILIFTLLSINSTSSSGINNESTFNDVLLIEVTLDEILVEYKQPTYFRSKKDRILFVKYIKTQSNRLDLDNWYVIQVMFNRMDHKKCNWKQYYDKRNLNHSQSIARMKSGDLRPGFSSNSVHDSIIYDRVCQVEREILPDSLRIPDDVLFFESFANSPNRGCFLIKNMFTKVRHKFYHKEEKKKNKLKIT